MILSSTSAQCPSCRMPPAEAGEGGGGGEGRRERREVRRGGGKGREWVITKYVRVEKAMFIS